MIDLASTLYMKFSLSRGRAGDDREEDDEERVVVVVGVEVVEVVEVVEFVEAVGAVAVGAVEEVEEFWMGGSSFTIGKGNSLEELSCLERSGGEGDLSRIS